MVYFAFLIALGRVGLGLIIPALNTTVLRVLSSQYISQGSGVINFLRTLGAALGVNLFASLLAWREHALNIVDPSDPRAFEQVFWMITLVFIICIPPALGMKLKKES
jgi:hypothetical protein